MYDPMMDFYQQAIRFLFRQGVAVVISIVFAGVFWLKISDMETQARIDRIEIRRECSAEIAEIRQELRSCNSRNDELLKENAILHQRLSLLERRIKSK